MPAPSGWGRILQEGGATWCAPMLPRAPGREARPKRPSKGTPQRVVVLIAPGYDEVVVAQVLSGLRARGCSVALVGLFAGLIAGGHGLAVSPDQLLDQAVASGPPRLVFVPGGAGCVEALVADPRVWQLLEVTVDHGGCVAAARPALSVLTRSGLWPAGSDHHLGQGEAPVEVFVDQLRRRLLG